MVAYYTGSDHIEIGDLESKVKVTNSKSIFSSQFSVNFLTVYLSSLMSIETEI